MLESFNESGGASGGGPKKDKPPKPEKGSGGGGGTGGGKDRGPRRRIILDGGGSAGVPSDDANLLFYDSFDGDMTAHWTVTGGGAAQDTTNKKFGTSSFGQTGSTSGATKYAQYEGTGDWLGLQALASTGFTVEFWMRAPSKPAEYTWPFRYNRTNAAMFPASAQPAVGLLWYNGNGFGWWCEAASSIQLDLTPSDPSYANTGDGSWMHMAMCSDGTDIRVYFDGVYYMKGAASSWTAGTPSGNHEIRLFSGDSAGDNFDMTGQIDELIITSEVKYITETSFAVPTEALYPGWYGPAGSFAQYA